MKANQDFMFSSGISAAFNPIAGGGLSTDEFHADARATSSGTASQDTAGNSQCLAAGAPNRLWAIASVKFSA